MSAPSSIHQNTHSGTPTTLFNFSSNSSGSDSDQCTSSTEWAELLRRYRVLQEEVLWPYFELTERIRATQQKAMSTTDIIQQGIIPSLSSPS